MTEPNARSRQFNFIVVGAATFIIITTALVFIILSQNHEKRQRQIQDLRLLNWVMSAAIVEYHRAQVGIERFLSHPTDENFDKAILAVEIFYSRLPLLQMNDDFDAQFSPRSREDISRVRSHLDDEIDSLISMASVDRHDAFVGFRDRFDTLHALIRQALQEATFFEKYFVTRTENAFYWQQILLVALLSAGSIVGLLFIHAQAHLAREEQLKQALRNRELEEILSRLPVAAVIRSNGKNVYRNEAAVALCDVCGPLDHKLDENFSSHRADREITLTLRTTDGIKEVEIRSTRMRYKNVDSFLYTIVDITSRKEVEAARLEISGMATILQVASGISHEIRQPLGTISLIAQNANRAITQALTCERYADDTELQKLRQKIGDSMHKIKTKSQQISSIMKNMLELQRRNALSFEPFSPADVIVRTADYMRPQFEGHGVSFVVDIFDIEGCEVLGNDILFERVITNLAKNALQAYINNDVEGEKEIKIIAGVVYDHIVIHVCDRAGGIDPKIAANLFSMFTTTKSGSAGTGVGLALCKSMLERMDGRIKWYDLKDDGPRGTEFQICLPLAPKSDACAIDDHSPPSSEVDEISVQRPSKLITRRCDD